jgi:N-formylglutamate amidohydrolase
MEDLQDFDNMLKNLILEEVASGIKATVLSANIVRRIFEDDRYEPYRKAFSANSDKCMIITDELVASGDIKEIEYTLPNMDYRIKSFYLPADATIVNYVKKG